MCPLSISRGDCVECPPLNAHKCLSNGHHISQTEQQCVRVAHPIQYCLHAFSFRVMRWWAKGATRREGGTGCKVSAHTLSTTKNNKNEAMKKVCGEGKVEKR